MRKITLIILSFVLVSSLTGLSCSKKTTDQPTTTATTDPNSDLPTSNLTNLEVTSLDDLITTNYELAKRKAAEWHSDAVLVNLTIKFPKNLGPMNATQTYVFGSATDGKNWFSFSIAENNSKYIRAIIPKEDYLGTDITPVNTSYWKMNYLKAFQLAETNGGRDFRAENSDYEITATLAQMQPKGWLWWEIDYKSATTGEKLVLKINPKDSNVVDEQGNPLNITSTTTPTATATADTTE